MSFKISLITKNKPLRQQNSYLHYKLGDRWQNSRAKIYINSKPIVDEITSDLRGLRRYLDNHWTIHEGIQELFFTIVSLNAPDLNN